MTEANDVLHPTRDAAWRLEDTGYDALRESSRESRFAISNGLIGVRGGRAINRGGHSVVPPRTLVAGLFDTQGPEQPGPTLVQAPNWLAGQLVCEGAPLAHTPSDGSSYRRTLDLRRGLLLTECRLGRPGAPTVFVRGLRLASQSARAVGLQFFQLDIEDGGGAITLIASFEALADGLIPLQIEQDYGMWRTHASHKRLAMACAVSLRVDGEILAPEPQGAFAWAWHWQARPGQSAIFERIVAVARADTGAQTPGEDARSAVAAPCADRIAAHEAAWEIRHRNSDVTVEGDAAAQQALRFALYHLNSAANPDDPRVSIAARALTGADYRGHVFWDTEIYLVPFYSLTWPEAARALLMYRFHTLGAAREKAVRLGFHGAFYAWESAYTGSEATPDHVIGPDRKVVPILCGTLEQHIGADIAYAVWHYWQATGGDDFLRDYGAEIIIETARFWASRAQREPDGHCHIRDVIGPDEYHERIDDNAFTNNMARWNLLRALDCAAWLRAHWPLVWQSLAARLGLTDAAMQEWRQTADTLATGYDSKTGIYEQFAGYSGLEHIGLEQYTGRSVPMDVVLGRERVQRSQIIKQADVVALQMLLPALFSARDAAANFHYYASRCSHGSSLSNAMHGIVAARLADSDGAMGYFRATAAIDLADTSVAIDGGVHIAALGGLWMIAVFGFAGLSVREDGIGLDPHLPAGWRSLGFPLQWRGRHLRVRLEADAVAVSLEAGAPLVITLAGQAHPLSQASAVRLSTVK